MATKAKKYLLKTPYGRAVYPSLHKLDTEGKYPTHKYKTDLMLSPEDLASFKAALKPILKELGVTKEDALPFKKDKDGNELVRMKSKFIPKVFDSKNREFPRKRVREGDPAELAVDIGGGSTIRCQVNVFKYDKGVTLQVVQVQVKELKQWSAESAFDAEDDGYEVDENGATSSFDDDDTSEDSDGDDLDI